MASYRQIRADFDRDSVVVYQAYGKQIAEPTLAAGKFVSPFSWGRMTWIKPSFLWLMVRSGWGTKSNQQHILAIRIKRSCWDAALSRAVLTSFDSALYPSESVWREQFEQAQVHVQWDPERSLNGKKLEHRSIQVGISRHLIREFTDSWVVEIRDYTPIVRRIRSLYLAGNKQQAKRYLPAERLYPAGEAIDTRLGIG